MHFVRLVVVNVGDQMPDAELPDLAGNLHTLRSLYGQKVTVVCFWTIGGTPRSRLTAIRTLKDLAKTVAEPFGEKGRADDRDQHWRSDRAVQQQMSQAGAMFPTFLDPKGEFFAKVAKDRQMPRAFLLDAGGKILWFDVELPRDSLRDLRKASACAGPEVTCCRGLFVAADLFRSLCQSGFPPSERDSPIFADQRFASVPAKIGTVPPPTAIFRKGRLWLLVTSRTGAML